MHICDNYLNFDLIEFNWVFLIIYIKNMKKLEKFDDSVYVSEFIEGSDNDEHYQIQGEDYQIQGIM